MKAKAFPNWFNAMTIPQDFATNLAGFKGRKNLRFLQIGAFTGNASVWLLENILTHPDSLLIDVDPWSPEAYGETPYDWREVEEAYLEQTRPFGSRVKRFKAFSGEWLKTAQDMRFDFIYIDGDHTLKGVAEDARLAWPLLKPGGVLAFDDYEWEHELGPESSPKPAIDQWLRLHQDEIRVLKISWQVWIRKRRWPWKKAWAAMWK